MSLSTASGFRIATEAPALDTSVSGAQFRAFVMVIFTRSAAVLRQIFADERFWLAVYCVTACIASSVCIGRQCNNFLIFRSAFEHLVAGIDLYAPHPMEHADLFKYSPTFAILFAPFALTPYGVALTGWNLLTVTSLFVALRVALDPPDRLVAMQLTGLGLITTIDGTQTNGVIAALIVFAFAAFERRRVASAATLIAGGTLIKLFPAAALALAMPRKDRWRFATIFMVILSALIALPLLVTPATTLLAQYRSWYSMGSADAMDRGASVMRLMHDLLGYEGPNWPVQVAATAILLLPLARGVWSDAGHRRSFLASILVYSVIFNHKAEQPSYIIAVVGIAIWYAVGTRTTAKTVITGLVFASTVPVFIWVAHQRFFGDVLIPLEYTAAACTLGWLAIQVELLDLMPMTEAALPKAEMQPAD